MYSYMCQLGSFNYKYIMISDDSCISDGFLGFRVLVPMMCPMVGVDKDPKIYLGGTRAEQDMRGDSTMCLFYSKSTIYVEE